ncbi:3-keto-5-aminohexanoate cleavage protein [Kribbella sp. CA-293567]|uniref:3-keto-5-aminohexanoate cleavage protein n=1 Tax=Kribbella sp. CA-293567 TaxID=3002436 RepID=UPI0022DD77F3|nr:3-keto-5-aminohexanoate cleavage protein [Kribbella sp. CA-293567]WBQ03588.1 3-keto-5-aminohexanoate cleavage protein [Kribbella sp. CA-293567]
MTDPFHSRPHSPSAPAPAPTTASSGPEPAGEVAVLKACLNGDRSRADHPGVPITPAELAQSAYDAALAGAVAVHFHPRGADGRESLRWSDVEPAVSAVRARCPELALGVATREEIEPELDQRLALLSGWSAGPDFASVNWHEEGAEQVAGLLIERGIGIEAGLFTPDAARKFLTWSGPVVRVLVEALPGISPGADGVAAASAVLEVLPGGFELVVHGENEWAWPVLEWARSKRHGLRAGLEDMLTGPSGETVAGNGELVAWAKGSARQG